MSAPFPQPVGARRLLPVRVAVQDVVIALQYSMNNVVAAVCICACTQNEWWSGAQQSRCNQHLQRWARPDEHRCEAALLYVLQVRLHTGDKFG